jgi:hypothetical protein
MNKSSIGVLGLTLALGLAKDFMSGSTNEEMQDVERLLKDHFAVPASKKIPKTYLTHELERYTILPPDLRTDQQNVIIAAIKQYINK